MNTCPVCHRKENMKDKDHCRSCSARILTWGRIGATEIVLLADQNGDIETNDAIAFCKKHYIGKVQRSHERVSIFYTSLRVLGWTGKKLGRHRMYDDYYHNRMANFSYIGRNIEKKHACEICGGTEELHTHHIVPCKWGGVGFAPTEIMTLCKGCHQIVHKRLNEVLTKEYHMQLLQPYRDEIIKRARSVHTK